MAGRAALGAMAPDTFERFCGRLLRESGFESVFVTGRPGDGGIDGQGVIQLAGGMIGFPVYFQCKRYSGKCTGGGGERLQGRHAGSGRQGADNHHRPIHVGSQAGSHEGLARIPIDLIDGVRLAEKIKELRLGVSVTERIVEDVTVDSDWFSSF